MREFIGSSMLFSSMQVIKVSSRSTYCDISIDCRMVRLSLRYMK